MGSNYKPIGNYIQLVDERNKGLKVTSLLGLSISKQFIKSVANTIGTDMENYKIIRKNQFACSTMQVRRDKKMPIALYLEETPSIISQAYPIFEIIDTQKLLPEYLMMWFTRSEFDREACFHAVGGVRGSLEWEDFCGMKLPIPCLEKQQEIVREYDIIQNRIALNNKLITKLEETAQAIYKQWFVDFEFPDENGLPYKGNGGEMFFCEELEKEIPVGWSVGSLGSFTKISAGGDKPKIFSNTKTDLCNIPVLSNSSTNEGLYGYTNQANVFEKSITISARGAIIGFTVLRLTPFFPIVRLIVVRPLFENLVNYLFYTILNFKFDNQTSSAQGQLTVPDISSYQIITPDEALLKKYQKQSSVMIDNIEMFKKEIQILVELKELLLARMTKVEIENIFN
jgi:type I restriction enzyme S subunit